LLFLASRLILFIASPYEIIPGYGDYWNFYQQVELGIPFVDYWTEFPPVFPFLSNLIYVVVNSREYAFSYALAIFISLFQAGTIYLFLRIEKILKIEVNNKLFPRGVMYILIVVGLFYSWSYFDPIAVFFLVLSLYLLLKKKNITAAFVIALGALTKWFPILVLPALWKYIGRKKALKVSLLVIAIIILVWGGLYINNPEMTTASLSSQINKGSWETVWAIIDDNLGTGNFGEEVNRQIPTTALRQIGNSPVIPVWITLLVFGGLGLVLLISSRNHDELWFISFTGLTIVLFFLWSPGYSPQWILYLLPFILLCLPPSEGYLFAIVLVLIHLLEWPVLLSRGYFWSLKYIISLRSILLAFLGYRLYVSSIGRLKPQSV
jgi:hypothetical protein